jgi:hypothetical protein
MTRPEMKEALEEAEYALFNAYSLALEFGDPRALALQCLHMQVEQTANYTPPQAPEPGTLSPINGEDA